MRDFRQDWRWSAGPRASCLLSVFVCQPPFPSERNLGLTHARPMDHMHSPRSKVLNIVVPVIIIMIIITSNNNGNDDNDPEDQDVAWNRAHI